MVKGIRPFAKFASDSQVREAYGTEDRNVLNIHESLSAEAIKQLAQQKESFARGLLDL